MAQYKDLESILRAALGDYAERGFWLDEKGDDKLILYRDNQYVATFHQPKATIESIRGACQWHEEQVRP